MNPFVQQAQPGYQQTSLCPMKPLKTENKTEQDWLQQMTLQNQNEYLTQYLHCLHQENVPQLAELLIRVKDYVERAN